ncbi:MAG: SgcJ/EcaC family oxidoreductase [Marinibacterium sp.]|nr:SgcJ/EcaC family oxidoreductase [Marinibacterium sp.]
MPDTPEDIPRLFAKAWNARDAQALASLFVEDADFVNVVGLWWDNRDDIERAHHYGLTTFFRQTEIAARRVKVRQVSDDLAIIHTRWKLEGQLDSEGRRLDTRFAIMVFVAQRRQNGWAVLAAQNTDIVPGAETNVVRDGKMTSMDYRR